MLTLSQATGAFLSHSCVVSSSAAMRSCRCSSLHHGNHLETWYGGPSNPRKLCYGRNTLTRETVLHDAVKGCCDQTG